MRNQKGITLVALVITIIVLLILAGVSISLVVGQNGVLTQASNAVNTNEKASVKQNVEMGVASCVANFWNAYSSNTSVKVQDYLDTTEISKSCPDLETDGLTITTGLKTGTTHVDNTLNASTLTYKTTKKTTYTIPITISGTAVTVGEPTLK